MLEYEVQLTFESGSQTEKRYINESEAENAYAIACDLLGFGEDMLICVAFIESSEYGYTIIQETEF